MFDDEDHVLDDGWGDTDELREGEDLLAFLAADWAIDGDLFGLLGL